MRFIKYWLIAVLIVAVSALSFTAGRNYEETYFQSASDKDYQAACVLSDCCRNMIDNIGVDAEEIYYEYIDNLDCDPKLIITKEDMENYRWSY